MSPIRLLSAVSVAALIAAPGFANAQTTAPNTQAAAQAPATPATPGAPAAALAKPVAVQGDLVDTLKLNGGFTTFVKAVDATNLAGLLKTDKNLTVFAPTDAAFAAMPPGDLAKLMADKTALQKFVLLHIVNAPIPTSKIKGAKGPVPAASGQQILLDGSADNGPLKVGGADIIQGDVQTASGLLQVVDHVLTPADAMAAAPAEPASAAPSSPGA